MKKLFGREQPQELPQMEDKPMLQAVPEILEAQEQPKETLITFENAMLREILETRKDIAELYKLLIEGFQKCGVKF